MIFLTMSCCEFCIYCHLVNLKFTTWYIHECVCIYMYSESEFIVWIDLNNQGYILVLHICKNQHLASGPPTCKHLSIGGPKARCTCNCHDTCIKYLQFPLKYVVIVWGFKFFFHLGIFFLLFPSSILMSHFLSISTSFFFSYFLYLKLYTL